MSVALVPALVRCNTPCPEHYTCEHGRAHIQFGTHECTNERWCIIRMEDASGRARDFPFKVKCVPVSDITEEDEVQ